MPRRATGPCYEQAGPEAIEWLECQVGQRLDGAEGLAEAWRWIVAALREDVPVDGAMLRFAIAHLYAREVRRREPRFDWARYDDPLKAKLLGYNAPALSRVPQLVGTWMGVERP